MIENLSQYWDKADGKTKKKILGCIFKEKFEDFNFERCNHIFTPEIESIMLASKVLQKNKNKKEVKNDLLSKMVSLLTKVAAQLYPLPILNRVSTHLKLYAVLRQKFSGFPQIF